MKIVKTDGKKKVWIFEDGSEISFNDRDGYLKAQNIGESNVGKTGTRRYGKTIKKSEED